MTGTKPLQVQFDFLVKPTAFARLANAVDGAVKARQILVQRNIYAEPSTKESNLGISPSTLYRKRERWATGSTSPL